jgi:ubiquinone/menaquinone biosynthesis C-methylase UbiE
MDLYARTIYPWLCDLSLDRPHVARHRCELLADVRGAVLEIGFGTGLNLPYYPHHVQQITAIDPSLGMARRAERRIGQSGIAVERHNVNTEELPFEDRAFDSVVSTFTLCSVERVDRAIAEVYRVLAPGGRFFLLEHGLSSDPRIQTWQRRLNWLQRRLAGNCHLDRNMRELIGREPFQSIDLVEFYLERTPRSHGYLYRGVATKRR